MTVSKVSVRGRVKSRPGRFTNYSRLSPNFRIIEFNICRKIVGVYLMCIPPEKHFTFQGFAAHCSLLVKPFLYLFHLFWILNLMTLVYFPHDRIDPCQIFLPESLRYVQ